MASGPVTSWQIDGETEFIFWGPKITADGDCSHEIKRHLLFGKKAITYLDSILKSRDRYYLANKGPSCQGYGFSISHVWMWKLDYKETWALKYLCFWTVVLEKTLESPLDCKEIQPVHPKGDQSWVFIGRTDVEAEIPILWLSDVKNWLIWKDSDAGIDWRQEEKGMTEDEMVGWFHQLNGDEFEQILGVGDGLGGLECCCPWVLESQTWLSDWTGLNWTNHIFYYLFTYSLKRIKYKIYILYLPMYFLFWSFFISLTFKNILKLYFISICSAIWLWPPGYNFLYFSLFRFNWLSCFCRL